MQFSTRPLELERSGEKLLQIADTIKRCQNELNAVNSGVGWEIAAKQDLKTRLNAMSTELIEEAALMNTMAVALIDAAKSYRETEEKIYENFIANEIKESAADYIGNINWKSINWLSVTEDLSLILGGLYPAFAIKKLVEYLRKKHEEEKAEVDQWVSDIDDEATRELLNKNYSYAKKLQDDYEDADGEAKELYDKYKDDIVIKELTSKGSYHVNGELHLNASGDSADPRGAASIYYHESGHFIVYKEKWVQGSTLSDDFKPFDAAVKKDVKDYIDNIEQKYRDKYSSKYSGNKLDSIIKKSTEKELENILGGANSDVLDGISDMIQASTNGKYSITYGHGAGYWSQNVTRQANEAFAEIYSADFCDDKTEYEFIKKNFPNVYSEYTKLLEAATDK